LLQEMLLQRDARIAQERGFFGKRGALHEDLLDEYGAENGLDPYEVTEHSSKLVIWTK